MNHGVCIAAEVDERRIDRRIETRLLHGEDRRRGRSHRKATRSRRERANPTPSASTSNAADMLEGMLEREFVPDIVTDQTSAHDELEGYYPSGYTVAEADELREEDPETYVEESLDTMERHVQAILDTSGPRCDRLRVREQHPRASAGTPRHATRVRLPRLRSGVHPPAVLSRKGPFRWAALSGNPDDIHRTDEAVKELFPEKEQLHRWIDLAQEQVEFQGLPSRVCWLGIRNRRRRHHGTCPIRPPHQRTRPRRRNRGTNRRHARPPRRGERRQPAPRDGGHARRHRRRRRLADSERPAQLRGGRGHRVASTTAAASASATRSTRTTTSSSTAPTWPPRRPVASSPPTPEWA